MDPQGRGGREGLEGIEDGQTINRIYWVKKKSVFNKRGRKNSLGRGTLPNKGHGSYSSEAKAWHLKGWEIQLGRNQRTRRQCHF